MAVAEEARHREGATQVVAVLDARMDEVYCAAYAYAAGALAAAGRIQRSAGPKQWPCRRAGSLAGNAFAAYGGRLPAAAARIEALPTAAALLRLAPALIAAGQAAPAARALPLYIRDKVAQTTEERAALRAAIVHKTMSAVFKAVEAQFEPLTEARLDEVVAVERQSYDHPWTRGNFADSLRSGYQAQLLDADGVLLGYFVAMKGVDEVHLLNLTVAPPHQRQGWGRIMLDALAAMVARPGRAVAVAGSSSEQRCAPSASTSSTATGGWANAGAITRPAMAAAKTPW